MLLSAGTPCGTADALVSCHPCSDRKNHQLSLPPTPSVHILIKCLRSHLLYTPLLFCELCSSVPPLELRAYPTSFAPHYHMLNALFFRTHVQQLPCVMALIISALTHCGLMARLVFPPRTTPPTTVLHAHPTFHPSFLIFGYSLRMIFSIMLHFFFSINSEHRPCPPHPRYSFITQFSLLRDDFNLRYSVFTKHSQAHATLGPA